MATQPLFESQKLLLWYKPKTPESERELKPRLLSLREEDQVWMSRLSEEARDWTPGSEGGDWTLGYLSSERRTKAWRVEIQTGPGRTDIYICIFLLLPRYSRLVMYPPIAYSSLQP